MIVSCKLTVQFAPGRAIAEPSTEQNEPFLPLRAGPVNPPARCASSQRALACIVAHLVAFAT